MNIDEYRKEVIRLLKTQDQDVLEDSELLFNIPRRNIAEINAYFDGARAGIRLWAHWKDGEQYVGSCGMTLKSALQMLEDMRQNALLADPPESDTRAADADQNTDCEDCGGTMFLPNGRGCPACHPQGADGMPI